MKGLAEFVMRGRLPALLVTMAGAGSLFFCWISAAALALVTLRKGVGQGAWVFLWALLPAIVLLVGFGNGGPLILICGTMAMAVVLRVTVSLPLAILSAVAVGIVTGLALTVMAGDFLALGVGIFDEYLTSWEQQVAQSQQAMQNQQPITVPRPDATQIAGLMGGGAAMLSVLCLLLARYWQAALYNPGGFGEEFRALYYPAAVSSGLVVAAIALFSLGLRFQTWAAICLVPLSFAGLSLVHARARLRGQSIGWLTGFYIAWLVLDLVKLAVVFFAIVDSWRNFRRRWSQASGSTGKELRQRDERNDKDDNDI